MLLDSLCNMTFDCNFSQPYRNETFRLVLGFGLGVSSLMSIIENAIVVIVLLKYRILRTPSNAILLSLATANFFVGFLVAPLYSLEWLNLIPFPHSAIVITARESLIRVFFGISTLTMAFISYDRYLHIRNLKNYKMNKRLLYGGLTLCWLAPIAISSLYLPNVHFKKTLFYVEIISTVFSVLTLAAIIIPYGGVLLVLKRQQNAANHESRITKMMCTENQRKASRTVAIIVTVYLVMNGPAIINEVLLYSYHLDMVCAFLVMANSSVNPIIYFYQTPSLKKHAMMLKKQFLVAMGIEKQNKGSAGSRGSREHEPAEVMIIIDSELTPRNSRYEYEKKLCSVWSHFLDKSKTIDGSTFMVGMKYPYCFDEPTRLSASFV